VKEKASQKIDGIVALAMATHAALQQNQSEPGILTWARDQCRRSFVIRANLSVQTRSHSQRVNSCGVPCLWRRFTLGGKTVQREILPGNHLQRAEVGPHLERTIKVKDGKPAEGEEERRS